MTKVSEADEQLIKTNVELTLKYEEADQLNTFYRNLIDDLERELKIANSYSELSHRILTREMCDG